MASIATVESTVDKPGKSSSLIGSRRHDEGSNAVLDDLQCDGDGDGDAHHYYGVGYSGEQDELEARSIRVVVRVRPLLAKEVASGERQDQLVVDAQSGVVHMDDLRVKEVNKSNNGSGDSDVTGTNKRRSFGFDVVMDNSTTQADVFKLSKVDEMIDATLEGFDATIFAYGQTGSGKTFTMGGFNFGEDSEDSVRSDMSDTAEERLGIVPQAGKVLFKQLRKRCKENSLEFRVRCSYMQIYNERILDLLGGDYLENVSAMDTSTGLKMRFNASTQQFYVENLAEEKCSGPRDIQRFFQQGVHNKVMGSHKLNTHSSRSHCVFTVMVDTVDPATPQEIKHSGRLSLIDLAGSERVRMTGAEGHTLKEATCINKSLFALRNVIGAISRAQEQGIIDNNVHIPFRDSKLTSLLKHSLGGTSLTLMIACVSPSDAHCNENLSTLAYASRASKVKNRPVRNEDPKSKLVRKLRAEIKLLRKQLRHAQQMSTIALGNKNASVSGGEEARLGSASPSASASSSYKQLFKQSQFLKQELLNSIEMMKKMHEIELELRSRMEAAEKRNDELELVNAGLNSENQGLREYEHVLIHLLDANDIAAPNKAKATAVENNNKAAFPDKAKNAALAKQLLNFRNENAELRDTVATLREMSSTDFSHEYANIQVKTSGKSSKHVVPTPQLNAAASALITPAVGTSRKTPKGKKKRRPQVMSVGQLRSLLSGSNHNSNNMEEDGDGSQDSSKNNIFMSTTGSSSTRITLSDKSQKRKTSKPGPHRPLLVKTGSKPSFVALRGMLSVNEELERQGLVRGPEPKHVNPTTSYNTSVSASASTEKQASVSGSTSPLAKMSAITELLRVQSKLKTKRNGF